MSSEEQDIYKTPKKGKDTQRCPNAPEKTIQKKKVFISRQDPVCRALFEKTEYNL
jgi:hypothetical protein